jgi:hypothetical protein
MRIAEQNSFSGISCVTKTAYYYVNVQFVKNAVNVY